MIQDNSLADRMYKDLELRILPEQKSFDSSCFFDAVDLRRTLENEKTRQTLRIRKEASVWQLTNEIYKICQNALLALRISSISESEVTESSIGVIVDRFYTRSIDNEDGLIVWEDKSPSVFAKHCTDSNILGMSGMIVVNTKEEKGFRAMIFKVKFSS